MSYPQYPPAPSASRPAPAPGFPAPGYPVPAQSGNVAYPAGPPAYPGSTQLSCRLCGCVPAVDVTFRQHRGMIVLMQFMRSEGPFCRDCGLAVFRETTAKTLIQGWWGFASTVITPVTVLINAARRGKVANLEQPRPPAGGRPYRRPVDPSPALFARPSAIIGVCIPALVVVAIFAIIVVGALGSSG